MKKITSNTYYTIATKDGHVLEVAGLSHEKGAGAQLWENAKGDSQTWLAVEVSDGIYKLQNKLSGKVLDVIAEGANNGAWLHQWEYIGKDNQLWSFEEAGNGYKIKSKLSGKVLDVVGGKAGNGVHVQIWEDIGGENQIWKMTEVKENAAPKAAKKASAKAPAKVAEPKAPAKAAEPKAPAKAAAKKEAEKPSEVKITMVEPIAKAAEDITKPVIKKPAPAAPFASKSTVAAPQNGSSHKNNKNKKK
ncbi:MAG: RICIN domain-containing protein [Ruthenibacterium sp.]